MIDSSSRLRKSGDEVGPQGYVLAMVSLILGLVLFLLEVQLAIRQNPWR